MRILHVHSGQAWGDTEVTLATLARHAALAPALSSEFALCADGRLRRELDSVGAPVVELGRVHAHAPWSVVGARRTLRRLLAEREYDAVVCHSVWTQAVFGGVPRTLGVPEVFCLHERVRHHDVLTRWAARHPPDWSLANSELTRAGLAGLFAVERSTVVYPPFESRHAELSADQRRVLRAELGFDDDTVVIVQASRLDPANGQSLLLRALSRLPPPTAWFGLQIATARDAAERRFRARLEEEARALGVTARVRFLDEPDDLARLLGAADIYCQPSVEPEPFGFALVRALAAGLPVIAFDRGAAREIVSDDVGRLASDDDKLDTLLQTLVQERALRLQLGAAGPARVRLLCDPAERLAELVRALERVTTMPRLPTRGR